MIPSTEIKLSLFEKRTSLGHKLVALGFIVSTGSVVGYAAWQASQLPVEGFMYSADSNSSLDALNRTSEMLSRYNFLSREIQLPQRQTTEADIKLYDDSKLGVSETERAKFYQEVAIAHEAVSYGPYFTDQVEVVETDRLVNPDILLDLVMGDMGTLLLDSDRSTSVSIPIFTEVMVPDYVSYISVEYPPMYLVEVMVRDALILILDPLYVQPDRTEHFQAGVAMGLYNESDIDRTSQFIEEYFNQAEANTRFLSFSSHSIETQAVSDESFSSEQMLEISPEVRSMYDEYQAAIEQRQQEFIRQQSTVLTD